MRAVEVVPEQEEQKIENGNARVGEITQKTFGLLQANANELLGPAYQQYLDDYHRYKQSEEFKAVEHQLKTEMDTLPIVMQVGDRSFRLDEFYQVLNSTTSSAPSALETSIRERLATRGGLNELNFVIGEFYEVQSLLGAMDGARKLSAELDSKSMSDDEVLIVRGDKAITAGQVKKSLEINFSPDSHLSDSEKNLLEDLKELGKSTKGEKTSFPNEGKFGAEDFKKLLDVNNKREKFAGQFKDISVEHKTLISKSLSQFDVKPLDKLLEVAVQNVANEVRSRNRDEKNAGKKMTPDQLQGAVARGLLEARKLTIQKKDNLEPVSHGVGVGSVKAKFEVFECTAQVACIGKLHQFNKAEQSQVQENRKNLSDPRVRENFVTQKNMLIRQGSLEEVAGSWDSPSSRRSSIDLSNSPSAQRRDSVAAQSQSAQTKAPKNNFIRNLLSRRASVSSEPASPVPSRHAQESAKVQGMVQRRSSNAPVVESSDSQKVQAPGKKP